MIDPRDFYDGPAAEGEPFEPWRDPAPRFGVGPAGIAHLREVLGLPAPPESDPVAELGDPEAKW